MSRAIAALAPDSMASWVDHHENSWDLMPGAMAEVRRRLWLALLDRAYAGEVVFRGARHGETTASKIHPTVLPDSKPDFVHNTLELAGVLHHAVRVFPAADFPVQPHVAERSGTTTSASAPPGSATADQEGQPGAKSHPSQAARGLNLKAVAWMEQNVRPGVKWEDAIQDCKRATGCKDREARDAWKALPTEKKGRQGVHK